MRQRPWALLILAGMHFLAPIGNIIFNALILNRNVINYFIYAMSPEYLARNWMIIVAPIVAGFAIYACKKWSFYVYLFALLALFTFSYSSYVTKASAIGILPVVVVYLVNILVVSYFLIPAVRSIYFDRRMRWWEIQARYKCSFRCTWEPSNGEGKVEGAVGNISVNGLFLKADEMPENNQTIRVEIPFNHDVVLTFSGKAIIHSRVEAIGFGVKFTHTAESKRAAQELVANLEAKGMRISIHGGRVEDSFSYWLRTLLTTGKGILPDKDE